jgi:hypothetical protein
MAIDWKQFDAVGTDLLDLIKPYLPALAREGPDVFDGFIKNLIKKDWGAISTDMYRRMTPAERLELDKQVIDGAYKAAQARYRQIQLEKEILMKIVIRLALTVIP